MSKFSITGKQAVESASVVKQLSAVDKEGKSLYKFDGKAKVVLSKRLKKLIEIVEDLDKDRQQLLTDMGVKADTNDKELVEKFNAEYEKMLEVEHEIECGPIKVEWLNLDVNVDLPHTFLLVLDWMIDFSSMQDIE